MPSKQAIRIDQLEQFAAEMYQVAGAVGAPLRILDQLAAAASGKPLPHETVLPFYQHELKPLAPVKRKGAKRKRASSATGAKRKR